MTCVWAVWWVADWTDWVIEKRRAVHAITLLIQYTLKGDAQTEPCDGLTSCQTCSVIHRGMCLTGFHDFMGASLCSTMMYRCSRPRKSEYLGGLPSPNKNKGYRLNLYRDQGIAKEWQRDRNRTFLGLTNSIPAA